MVSKYTIVNGTSYHKDTNKDVIRILEKCRINQTRISIDYGDTTTGISWGETYDTKGRIGRSSGTFKIPILLYNTRSIGGSGILTQCILEIRESKGGKILYKL